MQRACCQLKGEKKIIPIFKLNVIAIKWQLGFQNSCDFPDTLHATSLALCLACKILNTDYACMLINWSKYVNDIMILTKPCPILLLVNSTVLTISNNLRNNAVKFALINAAWLFVILYNLRTFLNPLIFILEYLKENKPQTAHTCLEFVKQERKRDLLKQKSKKAEETLLNDSVKENSQEEDAVEEKEKKSEEQLRSGKAGSNFLTPRNKMLSKLKKQYVFSETTENLYHGLPTSRTKSTKCSLCNNRHAGQHHCKEEESKVKKLSGLHEPPFSKVTNIRQKDSLTEAEGCAHTIFSERKKSLMKELFGQGNVCKDSHSCSNTRGMERKLWGDAWLHKRNVNPPMIYKIVSIINESLWITL